MNGLNFLDTNILVYTDDEDSPEKKAKALTIYTNCRRQRQGVLSTQVLQEYFVTVTRKLGVDIELARRKTNLFSRLQLVILDRNDILGAIDIHRLYQISFWDALIVRAALISNCKILYSEDMQHGWKVEGLQIINPFV
jgi:predicted nucleic acid-binding protein